MKQKKTKITKTDTLKLCLIGVFTALTIVGTILIRIPTFNGSSGYINFGDSIIFIASAMMGGIPGMIIGGVGSALADVIVGEFIWAPFTLVIKGLEGFLCGFLISRLKNLNVKFAYLVAMFISSIWHVFGYFWAEAIVVNSIYIAFTGIPGSLVQIGGSIVIGYILTLILTAIKPIQNVMQRIK